MRKYDFHEKGDIDFVASVSKVNRAQFEDLTASLEELGLVETGLNRLMFCPLTASKGTEETIHSLSKSYDINVACDSGGYESQIGDEYSMRDIYQFDREYYRNNDWPDELVLPDQVPIGDDDPETIEHKVQDTISLARMLYQELDQAKQKKAVPVIQGHTKEQVVACLDAYSELEHVNKVGFGSFSTGGVNGGVNYLTKDNIELLQFVVKEARKHDLKVHAFGVGGPTSLPILYQCGVDTFDSTGWMRSGGYGNVFFPFKSRYNITHQRDRSGPTVYQEEIRELQQETGHKCPFCESFDQLQESRLYRILHNLLVMKEMTTKVKELDVPELLSIMNPNSRYTGYLEEMANPRL
jgi:hypothetical protein